MAGAPSSSQCLCFHARRCATYLVTNTLRCTTTTLKRRVEVVKTDPVPDGQHVHLEKEEASSQVLTSTVSNEQLALPQGEWILEKDGGSMCLSYSKEQRRACWSPCLFPWWFLATEIGVHGGSRAHDNTGRRGRQLGLCKWCGF